MYKLNYFKLPDIFPMFVHNYEIHDYETRQLKHFHLPPCRTNFSNMSIKYQGPIIWNEISSNVDIDCSIGTFKKRAKMYINGDHVLILHKEYCLTLSRFFLSWLKLCCPSLWIIWYVMAVMLCCQTIFLWLFCVCFWLTPCHRNVDISCNRYGSL